MIRTGWVTAALLPVLAGLAGAQTHPSREWPNERWTEDEPVTATSHAKALHPTLARARDLMDARVVDNSNKWLGTIHEIVLTPDCSAVDYAVLSYGGFWGVPEKRFAVPWSQLRVRPGEKALALNAAAKDVGMAQGLERNRWPNRARQDWLVVEQARRGTAGASWPRSSERPGAADQPITDLGSRRIGALIDTPVANLQDEKLGEIHDLVIDMREGKSAYAIVAIAGDSANQDAALAAVPWSALTISPVSATARLNADRQTLAAFAFEADRFPDLENAQYSRALHDQFNATPYTEALGYVPAEDEPQD